MISKASFDVSTYNEKGETFSSSFRNKAIILYVLSELDETEKAANIALDLSKVLNDNDHWMSTQTTAYCLLAMGQYIQNTGGNNPLSFEWKSTEWEHITGTQSFWQIEQKFENKRDVNIENTSEATLFMTITNEGLPITEDTNTIAKKLSLDTYYTNRQGVTIQPDSIPQGEDFIAIVTVRNHNLKKKIKRLALTQIFPSGWEIHNSRLSNNNSLWRNKTNYEDIRDDRVNLFYDLNPGETKTFKIYLNASYEGRYLLPAVQTEAMYDHSIQARTPGKWVNVIKQ